MSVHLAELTDAYEILPLLRAMHEESPRLNIDPFSEERALLTIHNLITMPIAFAVIAFFGTEIIGFMGAVKSPALTSNVVTAGEIGLYVKPEHRGCLAAVRMVRRFEEWAKNEKKIVGTSLHIDDKAVIKFYERLGYREIGRSLMK